MRTKITSELSITIKLQKFSELWIPKYVHDFQVFSILVPQPNLDSYLFMKVVKPQEQVELDPE